MKLNWLSIRSFKGGNIEIAFENETTISGANGTGKTRELDAFLWLIAGKDSTGRIATGRGGFGIWPTTNEGRLINGVIVLVEAGIEHDGTEYKLRKEMSEVIRKLDKRVKGYTSNYWIDDVPNDAGDFDIFVKTILPSDKFEILANLRYFLSDEKKGGIHWTERKEVLCELAGKIKTPKGFDDLFEAIGNRDIDGFKLMIAERKNKLLKDQKQNNTRLDENHQKLKDATPIDAEHTETVETLRTNYEAEIEELDSKRKELTGSESTRQEKINLVNQLEKKQSKRETELEQTATQDLLTKKTDIANSVAKNHIAHTAAEAVHSNCLNKLESAKDTLGVRFDKLGAIRLEKKIAEAIPVDNICLACEQPLTEEMIAGVAERRDAKIKAIDEKGAAMAKERGIWKNKVVKAEESLKAAEETLAIAANNLHLATVEKDNLFQLIDQQIEEGISKVNPAADETWQTFDKAIKKAKAEIGKPVTEQLQKIDDLKVEKNNLVKECNDQLAASTSIDETKARIAVLDAEEKRIAQDIATADEQLAQIAEYEAQKSKLIESAINDKFHAIKFRLQKNNLQGNPEPCCDAMLDGKPYTDMSTGEQIYAGVDAINTLSKHYGLSIPLFIDNAESLTKSLDFFEGQVILLVAVVDQDTLKVE